MPSSSSAISSTLPTLRLIQSSPPRRRPWPDRPPVTSDRELGRRRSLLVMARTVTSLAGGTPRPGARAPAAARSKLRARAVPVRLFHAPDRTSGGQPASAAPPVVRLVMALHKIRDGAPVGVLPQAVARSKTGIVYVFAGKSDSHARRRLGPDSLLSSSLLHPDAVDRRGRRLPCGMSGTAMTGRRTTDARPRQLDDPLRRRRGAEPTTPTSA